MSIAIDDAQAQSLFLFVRAWLFKNRQMRKDAAAEIRRMRRQAVGKAARSSWDGG